jgi:sporulation protein YhbH
MSAENLSDIWKLKRRGKRDSDRHKELIKKAIKENSKDLITQYDVITTDGTKKVKVPIKFLDQHKFKYGSIKNQNGVGQGLGGKKGSRYRAGGKKKPGKGNKPGTETEEHVYEEEISIDEMVDILLKELNLPWLAPTQNKVVEIENEEFSSIEKKGLMANLDLKKSILNNIKKNIIKKNEKLIGQFEREELRYRTWETEKEYHSKAAVYMLLDRSGSMTTERKEIAKIFYFWMVQFLKRKYKDIDLVFIAHDTKAQIVTEKEFFSVNSGGGTACSSAFKLALDTIKERHNPEEYNNYVFEFSDGDNYMQDNLKCVEVVKDLLPLCRAIGYGEILLDDFPHWMRKDEMLSVILNKNIQRTRFMTHEFTSKEDVFLGLKRFFNIEGINKKAKVSDE